MSTKFRYLYFFVFILCLSSASAQLNPGWKPFYHGVASGDPLSDRVIIWTRVTPDELSGEAIEVSWKVATDPGLDNIVQSGTAQANADRDYTVKVDVTGLEAGSTYYYGFSALEANSLTGKTKTTPTGNSIEHLKFGVLNCASFQTGYYNAYRSVAQLNDLDAIIYLGDYIYEYASGDASDPNLLEDRPIEPLHELLTLEDYRLRYSTYHLDTNLIRIHQQHPFISVWDDHETTNNSWRGGAGNHDPLTEGSWEDRKAAGKQAFFDWIPIRENPEQRIYRDFQFGDLVDLFMLDTRLEGRDEQINDILEPALQAPDRTILGSNQKEWLKNKLLSSTAKWKILGNQVVFSKFNSGWLTLMAPDQSYFQFESQFLDNWNGYPHEQAELLQFIKDNNINNIVIASGDLHVALGFDIPLEPNAVELIDTAGLQMVPLYSESDSYDPGTGAGSVAVEFVSPSITTPNFDEIFGSFPAIILGNLINTEIVSSDVNLGNPNPHLKYADITQHGYLILDVSPDSVQGNWYFAPINTPVAASQFDEAWYSLNGENHLRQALQASPPKANQDTPAPLEAPLFTSLPGEIKYAGAFAFLGLYPNPMKEAGTLHFALSQTEHLKISVLDETGSLLKIISDVQLAPGIYTLPVQLNNFPTGTYFFKFESGSQLMTVKGIRME